MAPKASAKKGPAQIRLNRLLAQQGITSRRKADVLISAGRVTIDGKVMRELGTRVNPKTCVIAVDGLPLEQGTSHHVYFLLNKPKGVVSTVSDPEGRRTVLDLIPTDQRVFPVGRLDYDTEGALLITNDGDLTHRLTHPTFGVQKDYLAKVKGKPTQETINRLRKGVRLEDGFVKPKNLSFDHGTKLHSWFKISVTEGRKHIIRRLWMRVKHPVIKLIRTEFAGLKISDLKPGQYRSLKRPEVRRLYELAKGKKKQKA